MHNQFTLDEHQADAASADAAYRNWLLEHILNPQSVVYHDLTTLAQASLHHWLEISYDAKQKHGQILAEVLEDFAIDVAILLEQDEPQARPLVEASPALEPVMGYLEEEAEEDWQDFILDYEDQFFNEPWWMMYEPVAPRNNHLVNPDNIIYVEGRESARICYKLGNEAFAGPKYGKIKLPAGRWAKASYLTATEEHVQDIFAHQLAEFIAVDADFPLDYQAELWESSYDDEIASRYGTDLNPNSESNWEAEYPAGFWLSKIAQDAYQEALSSGRKAASAAISTMMRFIPSIQSTASSLGVPPSSFIAASKSRFMGRPVASWPPNQQCWPHCHHTRRRGQCFFVWCGATCRSYPSWSPGGNIARNALSPSHSLPSENLWLQSFGHPLLGSNGRTLSARAFALHRASAPQRQAPPPLWSMSAHAWIPLVYPSLHKVFRAKHLTPSLELSVKLLTGIMGRYEVKLIKLPSSSANPLTKTTHRSPSATTLDFFTYPMGHSREVRGVLETGPP